MVNLANVNQMFGEKYLTFDVTLLSIKNEAFYCR